jgi:hypothetical protein
MYRVGTSRGGPPLLSWWKLYAAVIPGLALVVLAERTVQAGVGRVVVQIVAVLALCGGMALWVHANKAGLALSDRPGSNWRRTAIETTSLAWRVPDAHDAGHRTQPAGTGRSECREAPCENRRLSLLPLTGVRGGASTLPRRG